MILDLLDVLQVIVFYIVNNNRLCLKILGDYVEERVNFFIDIGEKGIIYRLKIQEFCLVWVNI